jgi:hypothetical protein
MAVTALWSNFHDSLVSTLTGTAIKNRNNSQDIIPVLEAGLGLTYMTWFSNESYQFYAKAGWEEQIWLDYNHNNITAQDNNTGNLSLQGLTVKAGFAF